MPEYNFTEMTTLEAQSSLALLRELHHDLSKVDLDRALNNQYRLLALRKQTQLVGLAGIHLYPHLSDAKRAWIHDLISVREQESSKYKTILLAHIRNQFIGNECSEIAIHVPIDNESENAFFLKLIGRPFAYVYEWKRGAWTLQAQSTQSVDNFQCKEIKTPEDRVSELTLLKHFHPMISEASLTRATDNGYRIYGLWIDRQLCSIATLIQYPHLKNRTCAWLQDGMTLPTKDYKQAASRLFGYVMDSCFNVGNLTVSVHARIKNKRIHKFYETAGGRCIANAYKWKDHSSSIL